MLYKYQVFLKSCSARGYKYCSNEALSCGTCLQLQSCGNTHTSHRSDSSGNTARGKPASPSRSQTARASGGAARLLTLLEAPNSNWVTQEPHDPLRETRRIQALRPFRGNDSHAQHPERMAQADCAAALQGECLSSASNGDMGRSASNTAQPGWNSPTSSTPKPLLASCIFHQ